MAAPATSKSTRLYPTSVRYSLRSLAGASEATGACSHAVLYTVSRNCMYHSMELLYRFLFIAKLTSEYEHEEHVMKSAWL